MKTAHGHHIEGSPVTDEVFNAEVARCGGPGLCADCSIEANAYKTIHMSHADFHEDTSGYSLNNDRFLREAKQFVVGANAVETAESGEHELSVDELYIVWFSKTLKNWKALISTSIPGDGLYFEVTHNGEKNQTYVDIYKKTANHQFDHNHF